MQYNIEYHSKIESGLITMIVDDSVWPDGVGSKSNRFQIKPDEGYVKSRFISIHCIGVYMHSKDKLQDRIRV